MVLVLLIALVTALSLAWTLTSRCQEHRPAAVLLSVMFAVNAAEYTLDTAVLAPLRASLGLAPWTGWAWGAAVLTHAVELVWPAALVGAALVVFARRSPWVAVAAWALAVLVYVAVHPTASDGGQARFHAIAQLLAAVASAGLAIVAWRRRTSAVTAPASHVVLSVIILAELLALPAELGLVSAHAWPAPGTLYFAALAALAFVQGYAVLERHERRLDGLDTSTLKAHVIAAAAVRTAERAEGMATEARDLADNIPAAPPSSRRSPTTPTPTS